MRMYLGQHKCAVLRAIAAGFDTITGSVDDPSAKQVDGYFRGYAMVTP